MKFVDSHCHLDLLVQQNKDSLDNYLQRAKSAGVTHILNVCVTLEDFSQVLAIAEKHDNITASVGLHPNEVADFSKQQLLLLAQHPKVVAIGETGLDYYRTSGDLSWQHQRFRDHIEVAKTLQKPLIVHTRDAREDTLRIMQEEKAYQAGGVMHCFSENWAVAQAAMEMNFFISFSGVVTFKNAHDLQEVARHVPLEYLLIETDAPYLAPTPYRGKVNEPAYVVKTAEFIAHLKGLSTEQIAEASSQNFFRLFAGAANV